jgi:hypothetical protein
VRCKATSLTASGLYLDFDFIVGNKQTAETRHIKFNPDTTWALVNKVMNVGLKALREVTMKRSITWDVTLCVC